MEEDSLEQEGRDFFGEYSEIEDEVTVDYSLQSNDPEREQDSASRENKLITVLLQDTNKLLSVVGIGGKQVLSYNELCRVSSSLFVAVFEALFNIRIDGINRNPRSQADYIRNAQLVIDALGVRMQVNLDHIKGTAIVSGDYRTLSDLVKLLLRIESISIPDNSPTLTSPSRSTLTPSSSPESSKVFDIAVEGLQQLSPPSSPHRTLSSVGSANSTEVTKQQAAEQRRVRSAILSDVRRRDQNIRTALRSHKMLRDREIADQVRDTQAFCMRRSSQEQATVREVQKGLFEQFTKLKIDEANEEKQRGQVHREQCNWYAQSLSQLLENSVSMERERTMEMQKKDREAYRQDIRRMSEMLRNVKERSSRLLSQERNRLQQMRDHELVRRNELHQILSSLVARNSWEGTLRIYPAKNDLVVDTAKAGFVTANRGRTSNALSQSYPLAHNHNRNRAPTSSSNTVHRRGRSASRRRSIRNKDLGQGAWIARRSHSLV